MSPTEIRRYFTKHLNSAAADRLMEALEGLPLERIDKDALNLLLKVHNSIGGRAGTDAIVDLVTWTKELIKNSQMEE